MWRDFFMLEYAEHNGTLIFKVKLRYHNDTIAFTFPIGRDIDGSIREIDKYCRQNGIPMIFCTMTEQNVNYLAGIFKSTDVIFNPDWSDYLYGKDDLILLAGRKYSGQRNHINYFKKTYENYRFTEITDENILEVKAFYNKAVSAITDNSEIFLEERAKTLELLENYPTYGLLGGALYIENDIAAFAIGELINDTLFVHVERADHGIRGAYQMIMNLFAAHYAKLGTKYINREEDVGDEGLRNAKNALHPVDILRKYTVVIND